VDFLVIEVSSFKETNRIDVSLPSLEDRNLVFCSHLEYLTMDKVKETSYSNKLVFKDIFLTAHIILLNCRIIVKTMYLNVYCLPLFFDGWYLLQIFTSIPFNNYSL
jgi:hypothetical protein